MAKGKQLTAQVEKFVPLPLCHRLINSYIFTTATAADIPFASP
jgi:hypothetical protein